MTLLKALFVCIPIFLAISSGQNQYIEESCDRIRRPLHLLSTEERLIYVEAFKILRENGKLDIITQTHGANMKVHYGSNFYFFHAYLVLEIEEQIRSLGGKFKCFAMPYWDFTYDAGSETDPMIFHAELGGDGAGLENDYCVEDELWTIKKHNYWTPEEPLCFEDEEYPYCCLKRERSTTTLFATSAEVAAGILESSWDDFSEIVYNYHFMCHAYFSSNDKCAMTGHYSTDDPIFYVLHSYVVYLRALWSSCWNYDNIDITDNYNAYKPSCNAPEQFDDCGAIELDDIMGCSPLDEHQWSLSSKIDITPRMMYNINNWGIKYELGTFWENSHLDDWCGNDLTKEWFFESNKDDEIFKVMNTKKSDVQQYIDQQWNDNEYVLNEENDIEDEFRAIAEYSCEYHRQHAINSCYDDEVVMNLKIETCDDRGITEGNTLSLDDLLGMEGVKDNECLSAIRRNMYHLALRSDETKLNLCNGQYDYKCNAWNEKEEINDGQMKWSDQHILFIFHDPTVCLVVFVVVIGMVWIMWNHYGRKTKKNSIDTARLYGTF